MRLLQALRIGKDEVQAEAVPVSPPLAPLEAAQLAASHAIGERQARLTGELDAIAQVLAHLQQLAPLVEGLREPLVAEFDGFRRDHADLLAARAQIEVVTSSERVLREVEQALKLRLSDAAKTGESQGVEIRELRFGLAAASAEAAGAREALVQAATANEDHHAARTAASLTIQRLEEEAHVLRAQADRGAEREQEFDARLASTRQEVDLAAAETAALRGRLDELIEQLSRGNRAEAQLRADLEAEREAAASRQAQVESHSRELQAKAQTLEAQLDDARTHAADLSARLEAGAARTAELEALCGELSSQVAAAMSEAGPPEGLADDEREAGTRAGEQIDRQACALAELTASYAALESDRLAAVERGDQLASALREQEAATARAVERGELLQASLAQMANEEEARLRAHGEETRQLLASLRAARSPGGQRPPEGLYRTG